jgi:very-short-patch-repair endonuclease
MRFGPLNNAGGERRLNVAITRAQHGMTVVSSMHPSEMNVEGRKNDGPKLLKAYLEYAEQGPSALPKRITAIGDAHDSAFEAAVAEELRRAGIHTKPQIGCAGYRIDLAVYDADRPGRFLLGIECDGATYHSASTARDRDRLRQEVLEGLGWTILRVWSTDWFNNNREQIDRIARKVEEMKRIHRHTGVGCDEGTVTRVVNSTNVIDRVEPQAFRPSTTGSLFLGNGR